MKFHHYFWIQSTKINNNLVIVSNIFQTSENRIFFFCLWIIYFYFRSVLIRDTFSGRLVDVAHFTPKITPFYESDFHWSAYYTPHYCSAWWNRKCLSMFALSFFAILFCGFLFVFQSQTASCFYFSIHLFYALYYVCSTTYKW